MRVRLYKKTKDNLSYFQFLSDDGQAMLNSQGYKEKDSRNNGVRSVISNAPDASRYERQTTGNGQHFFTLKAVNGQEIARSVNFDDVADMESALRECMTKIPAIAGEKKNEPLQAESTVPVPEPYRGKEGDDNYKPLSFYQERISGVANGIDNFNTEAGEFYFTLNRNDKIVLLSESYNSRSGRDNGADSVRRNLDNGDRYQPKVHPNGKHYFNLLAGNNQPIATSVWYDKPAEMETTMTSLQKGLTGGTADIPAQSGKGSNGELEGMSGYRASIVIVDAPVSQVTAPVRKKRRKKQVAKAKPAMEKVYLKSGSYLFNEVNYKTMRSSNGKYYFSFRTGEDKALLMNANVRGYETEEAVDEAVKRVLDLGPNEGNYEGKTTRNGKYYFYLKDAEGKNIAKSFFFNNADQMQDAVGLLIGRALVAETTAPQSTPVAKSSREEYLPCERYTGEPGFHRFYDDEEKRWYFSYNRNEGTTLLRSQDYQSEKAREKGIRSVQKNAPVTERWITAEEQGSFYYVLRAGNHQEIGRSCPFDDEGERNFAMAATSGLFAIPEEKVALANVEEYLPCDKYAGNPEDTEDGFRRFKNGEEWYFAYKDKDGNTVLRSQGYKSEKARENGISSVKKNAPIEDRWIKGTTDQNKHYYALRAGNNQEIGRSCYYTDSAAMLAGFAMLPGLFLTGTGTGTPADTIIPSAAGDVAEEPVTGVGTGVAGGVIASGVAVVGAITGSSVAEPPPPPPPVAKEPIPTPTPTPTPVTGSPVKGVSGGRFPWWLLAVAGVALIGWLMYQQGCFNLNSAAGPVSEITSDLNTGSEAAMDAAGGAGITGGNIDGSGVSANAGSGASGNGNGAGAGTGASAGSGGAGSAGDGNANSGNGTGAGGNASVNGTTGGTAAVSGIASGASSSCNCSGNANPIFNIPPDDMPQSLSRLGTYPELGNSHALDAVGFYNKLADRYAQSSRDKRFLDELFRGMGYANGFADASPDMFSETIVPKGTAGNIGFGKRHQTMYARLDLVSEKDQEAFLINAANGCHMHFMKTCGNHFFFCPGSTRGKKPS